MPNGQRASTKEEKGCLQSIIRDSSLKESEKMDRRNVVEIYMHANDIKHIVELGKTLAAKIRKEGG
jgi:hypothetical protein